MTKENTQNTEQIKNDDFELNEIDNLNENSKRDSKDIKNPITDTLIHDSLTNTLQPLPRHINIYICGPTVYDTSHLGHARTYILYDTILRTLNFLGHSTFLTQNITDIDDKIILKTKQFLSEFVKSNKLFMNGFNELFKKEEVFSYFVDEIENLNEKKYECVDKILEKVLEDENRSFHQINNHQMSQVNQMNLNQLHMTQPGLQITPHSNIHSPQGNVNPNIQSDHPNDPNITNQAKLENQLTESQLSYLTHFIKDKNLLKSRITFINDSFKQAFLFTIKRFTDSFTSDMINLNIKRPDVITKVTEYVEKIIEFIKILVSNGSAYEINGSVYFDMGKYLAEGNKRYFFNGVEEIEPSIINGLVSEIDKNAEKKDSSGDDSQGKIDENAVINPQKNLNKKKSKKKTKNQHEKKDIRDFALWKKSSHPISFNSPFGKGRPGWHIECSSMSNDIFFGFNNEHFNLNAMHLHGGGIDLQFPHHENEILQSISLNRKPIEEMYGQNENPIENENQILKNTFTKYFAHTGHLHIEGLKMSKSLKNFITIKDCLKSYSHKTLRICFLLSQYDQTAIYKVDTMEYAERIIKKIDNFMMMVESELKRRTDLIGTEQANQTVKKASSYESHSKNSAKTSEKNNDKVDQNVLEKDSDESSSEHSVNNTIPDPSFLKINTITGPLNESDRLMLTLLNQVKLKVISLLKNNFKFNECLKEILNFITITNQKVFTLNGQIINNIYDFVKKIMKIFYGEREIYFDHLESEKEEKRNEEEIVDLLVKFRREVRMNLKKKDFNEIFKESDKIREEMKKYGYLIEDKGNECVVKKMSNV